MEIVPWTYNNPRVDKHKLKKLEYVFQGHLFEIIQNTDVEIDVNKNTCFKLWDGAYLLGRYIEDKTFKKDFWKGKRCIEIGAGCGLVGQIAWALGANVTLTDLKEALPHTEKCVNANIDNVLAKSERPLSRSDITAAEYCWGTGAEKLSTPYDVILGSDVIYQASLAKHIVKAFKELSGPDTLILLSYKSRGLGEHITFDLLKREGFCINVASKETHPIEFMDSDYDLLHIVKCK